MEKTLLVYPAFLMVVLTIFLYIKNYIDNRRATTKGLIKFSYFKSYTGEVPDYVLVSRQTLKNQFELPIFFYFLTSLILIFDKVSQLDIVLSWIFVLSRYIHCYVRLNSNYVPTRAKIFQIGLIVLVIWWIVFLSKIL